MSTPRLSIFRAAGGLRGHIILNGRTGGEHFTLTLRGARRLARRVVAGKVADPGYSPWRFTRGVLVEELAL